MYPLYLSCISVFESGLAFFFDFFFFKQKFKPDKPLNHNDLFVLNPLGLGFTLKDLESVPFGVALPIREAIYRCREQPCSDWPEEVCLLIGRQDLTKQAHKMMLAKSKNVSGTIDAYLKIYISCKSSL